MNGEIKGKLIHEVFNEDELIRHRDACWRRYMEDRPCYTPDVMDGAICARAFKPISMCNECDQCLKDHPSLHD